MDFQTSVGTVRGRSIFLELSLLINLEVLLDIIRFLTRERPSLKVQFLSLIFEAHTHYLNAYDFKLFKILVLTFSHILPLTTSHWKQIAYAKRKAKDSLA